MEEASSIALPRVTIQFCTQCKWNLRAAYFAQELLSTFSSSLGEVALQPSTGGVFIINLYDAGQPSQSSTPDDPTSPSITIQKHQLWDRKAEGGFPETKELKRRVRDIIDPTRNLGHVDGKLSTPAPSLTVTSNSITTTDSSPTFPPTNLELGDPVGGSVGGGAMEKRVTRTDGDGSPSRGLGNGGGEDDEVVDERGKVRIGGQGAGFCVPGGDCENCG